MQLVHHGTDVFLEEHLFRFQEETKLLAIQFAGFWASPVESGTGLRDWSRDSRDLACSFEFSIEGRILSVQGESELLRLPWRLAISNALPMYRPFLERLTLEGIDALHVSLPCENEGRVLGMRKCADLEPRHNPVTSIQLKLLLLCPCD